MSTGDLTAELCERVRDAARAATPIAPRGGGSKSLLGRAIDAEPLCVAGHRGIVHYEPTELVVTARTGTPLAEIEAALDERGQMLAFEPPHLGDAATLGGTIAAGLSGPRRPYAGAARDFVLGTRIVNGRGEALRFGGEVMKNVAGYDLSRLVTGSMGTLALLLEVSLKVLPRPAVERTLAFEHTEAEAVHALNGWAGAPLPISAACHAEGVTRVRLSGTEGGVATAAARLGGEDLGAAAGFWRDLREQRLDFFAGERPLWRISLPSTAAPLALPGDWLTDWGGALRWLRSDADAGSIRSVVASQGGHATLFRGGDRHGAVHHPLPETLVRLHQRIKAAFDPKGIFSPGRMYAEV